MADNTFPLDEAEIVSLFVESIFYGLYIVSFGACVRILFSGAGVGSGINRTMLIAAVSMAIFGTLDLALALRHVLDAFIWYHGPGGATAEFENVSFWIQVTRTGCYVVQTLIGDLILIYRCYVVYNRRWLVIVVSLIMWTGTLACGITLIYVNSHLKLSTNFDEKHLVTFLTALSVLSMVQSLVTTSLIAFRILTIDRQVAQFRSSNRSKLRPTIRIIIESGAVYTISLIIFLVVFLCSNNAQYALSDAIMMIIGIVFNMIIVRIHQGRTAEQTATIIMSGTSSGRSLTFRKPQTSRGTFSNSHPLSSFGNPQTGGHVVQPVEVNVARQVVQDGDDDRDSVLVESTGNMEMKHWAAA